ncbi:MAG: PAS domain S-box protein [Bacteroidales bacterium]|nr:PAS domain S-box protein [Bacteroidales bacterium]
MENSSIKILVIDDLQDNLITLNALIKDAFPEAIVLKALNGETGLELAVKECPDVILLDIIMPGMDGYMVCQKLKADKELCDIPVVFVTAIENTKEALVKALESGGEAFLTKPIDETELTAQIRSMLKIRDANIAKKNEKFRLEILVKERNKELVQELEARKQAEKGLKKEKIFSEKIVETANAIIVGLDKNHIIQIFNRGAEQITSYKKEEVIGKDWFKIFFPKKIQDEMNKVWTEAWGIKSHSYTNPILAKSGEEKFVSWQTTGMYDSDNVSEHLVLSIGDDITERKRAEKALKESEEKFRGIYEQSPIAIEIYDKHGKLIDVNQQTMNMFGVDDKKHVLGFDLWADPNLDDEKIKLLKSGQEIFLSREFDFEIVKENKLYPTSRSGKIYMDMYAIPLLNDNKVTGFLVQIVETTERRQAVEKLKQSEERFRNLVNTINSGVAIYKVMNEGKSGSDYIIQEFNQFALKHEKMNKEEVIGKSLKDIRPNIDEYGLIDAFRKVWETGESTYFSAKVYKDEKYSNYYENRVFKLPSGEIVAVYDDVTERERAELALKESEERFNLAMNASNDGLFDWDLLTNEIYYSPAWKKMIGYEDHELPNDFSVWEKTTAPEDVKKSWELQQKLISKQIDRFVLEFKMKHIDGHWVDILSRANAIFDDKGKAIRIVGTHTDITERKQMEEVLKNNEALLNETSRTAKVGGWKINLSGKTLAWTNETFRIHELDRTRQPNVEEAINFYHPDDRAMGKEAVQKTIETGEPFNFEARLITALGNQKWVLAKGNSGLENGKEKTIHGIIQDINERKQAEEKIIQQNEFLNNIMESLTHPFYVIDVNDYSIIQGNSASGFSAGSNKTSCHALTHNSAVPCNSQYHPCPIEIVKKTNQPAMVEHIHFDESGNKKNVEVYCYPVFDKNGVIRSAIEYCLDVTKRKKAESELVKLSTAVQQSPSVIAITDTEGNLQYVNPQFTKSTGYSLEEAIGQNPRVLKSGEQSDEVYKELWKTITSGKVWRGEFHNKKKNGGLFWELASVSPIFDEQGKIVNYIKVAEDITERKLAEDNFRHSIDESPLGIRIVNQAGKNVYVNKGLLDIYEFSSPDEFLNTSAKKTYTEQSYQEHQDRRKIRQEGGDTSDYEISIRRKNREIRHIKVWRKDVIWNREKHFQVINQDITELKRLNTDLIQAKEKAEESNRLKTAFLNNMSHEIRTPLNGITGFIGLLQNPIIDAEEKQKYFDIINKSSDRLIATVNDIMDISRIEAGEVKVSLTEVSANEILEEQYSFFYHQAQSKGLELIFKPCLVDKEARFVTDKHKLEGILTNLIKNAIKFTEQGEITFSCSLKKEKDIEVLEFNVKDTGIGIPANRIDAIFNRFEQADIEDTRVHQGSGLGLAIVKSYVEMLGGEIIVSSEVGSGSTFTVKIPYTKQFVKQSDAKGNIKKETQTTLSNLSVIIAEDDETSIIYFDTIFKNVFKNITYTKTGKETFDKCRENPETDLILMDIKMPDMNGYDTTREIRKFNHDVIIIAQTAFGLSGDREKAIEAGCNDYIAKPINKDVLEIIIKKHFKNYK